MKRLLVPAFLLLFSSCARDIIKYHSKDYRVVKAGKQTWMAENLATSTFRNGKSIPTISDYPVWTELKTPGCGFYNNDSSMLKKYGMFYNWNAVSGGKLCPFLWRVPRNKDWDKLEVFLGDKMRAGGKIKSVSGWKQPHVSADDIGFKAVPGGYRLNRDYDRGESIVWWSISISKNKDFDKSELGDSYRAFIKNQVWIWGRRIHYSTSDFMHTLNRPNNGFYVRCIRGF